MRRHLFKLEGPRLTQGRQSWVELGDVWLRIRPLTGRLEVLAGREAGEMAYDVRLRYSTLVKPGYRFTKDSRVLVIESVTDIGGRQRWLSCRCRETVPVARVAPEVSPS